MQKFTCENKTKLSDFLLDKYQGGLSYGKFCSLIRKKDIKVNGKRVSKDCKLFQGDLVECYFNGEKPTLEVVYSDDNILICNKPQGITSEDYYKNVLQTYETAIYTHRLDRNTSGIITFALNECAYAQLYNGFKNRTFKKYYHCLVNGAFDKKQGVLNAYMVKDEERATVKVYANKTHGAKEICTKYEEIERGDLSSLLKVELVTGRTHQIRAHLAFSGHFIIGDGKYGVEKINKIFKAKTQLLISTDITFIFEKDSPLYYLNQKTFSVDFNKLYQYLK